MPEHRSFEVRIHTDTAPAALSVNGKAIPQGDGDEQWAYDQESQITRVVVCEDERKQESVTVLVSQ